MSRYILKSMYLEKVQTSFGTRREGVVDKKNALIIKKFCGHA
jgi:hypothetical protein